MGGFVNHKKQEKNSSQKEMLYGDKNHNNDYNDNNGYNDNDNNNIFFIKLIIYNNNIYNTIILLDIIYFS